MSLPTDSRQNDFKPAWADLWQPSPTEQGKPARGSPDNGAPERPLVVILGAGITGLTAAHELAERGLNVVVVERESTSRGVPNTVPSLTSDAAAISTAGPDVSTVGASHSGGDAQSPPSQPASPPASPPASGRSSKTRLKLRPEPRSPSAPSVAVGGVARTQFHRVDDPKTKVYLSLRDWFGHEINGIGFTDVPDKNQVLDAADALVARNPRYAERLTVLSEQPIEGLVVAGMESWYTLNSNGRNIRLIAKHRRAQPELPGEHGFRFFPAFYRNLFDTMKRTPLLGGEPDDRDPFRTTFSNLVPMENLFAALGDGDEPVRMPRRAVRSLMEGLEVIDELFKRTGYDADDVARYHYELIRWSTACGARREAWSTPDGERTGTWWDLIRAEGRFSDGFKTQLKAASMAFVGMRHTEIDARTFANTAIQLLLDQSNPAVGTDHSLNGPTTTAWFNHWKSYLEQLGVAFAHGEAERLYLEEGELKVKWKGPLTLSGVDESSALSLPAERNVQERWLKGIETGHISPRFWVSAVALPSLFELIDGPDGPTEGDFASLQAWKQDALGGDPAKSFKPAELKGSVPFRNMVGVQFFTRDHIHMPQGHTYFPNSEWALSSLTQTAHWRHRRHPYRGIISIDVCDFLNKNKAQKAPVEMRKEEFIAGTRDQLITGRGEKGAPFPHIDFAVVDQYLEYAETQDSETGKIKYGLPVRNKAPYLINLPGQWRYRPGKTVERSKEKNISSEIIYSFSYDNWVVAGPHCKTWTRLATMEAANESGRHAANAIVTELNKAQLTSDRASQGSRSVNDGPHFFQPIPVFNPEDHEAHDLELLRELDQRLCAEGLPHLFDALRLGDTLEELLGGTDEHRIAKAMAGVVASRMDVPKFRTDAASLALAGVLRAARTALAAVAKR